MFPATANRESVVRFGSFELDASNSELRRNGTPVKLPPQPFKVLVSLATRPGQLLTRNEIQQMVWGGKTFVDFELGVNYCLNQIRKALEDDARTPRYIETVPRRGYRFIAPVETVSAAPKRTLHVPPSLAVLPFTNLSGNKDNAYFSDGLADEIITALTRVHGLRVTARTSSFAFRGKDEDVREIGAKLGVASVLEGSVQRAHGRVRVSAQLVSVEDGFHLWSEHYDRKLTDIFAIEDEIARAIARALELRLGPSRMLAPTRNLEAYNCWLKARHHQHYEDMSALAKAQSCLDEAVALDPLFPQPYLSRAGLLLAVATFGVIRPHDAITQGTAAIRKAFDLDPSIGEGYALSGAYRAWDFDWQGAGADFDRALRLTPASEEAHRLRATYYLLPTGRLGEAQQEMEQAIESDPLSPLAYVQLTRVLLWARRFEEAQARMETAFELWPDYVLAKWFLGATYYFQGRIEQGLALWQTALQKAGANPLMIGAIGMALGQLGRHAEARSLLAELDSAGRDHYVPAWGRAQIYLGLGETDAVFEWLNRAVDQRDPHVLDLPCKPIWDSLRSDPRFTALLHKMRLA